MPLCGASKLCDSVLWMSFLYYTRGDCWFEWLPKLQKKQTQKPLQMWIYISNIYEGKRMMKSEEDICIYVLVGGKGNKQKTHICV